jgi:hypothetical protein
MLDGPNLRLGPHAWMLEEESEFSIPVRGICIAGALSLLFWTSFALAVWGV